MHKLATLTLLGTFMTFGGVACDKGGGDDGAAADETTGADDGSTAADGSEGADGEGGTEGAPEPVDTDEDGLTDEEEAELGTDPNKKDTDDDTYWDSWEVNEGTDPLDPESRIYVGYWPYNPGKEELEQGDWENAFHAAGRVFPRESFQDQNAELVDFYDIPGHEGTFFIIDLSTQWCGPCHNVADWLSGNINSGNSWMEDTYPTVRDKVHDGRIVWVTFLTQNNSGGDPTLADVQTWMSMHPDDMIPLFVDQTDGTKDMESVYGSNAVPFMFLGSPDMTVEFYPGAGSSTNENPYPAVGLVDTMLD
jgi:hypothetical protein